MTGAALPETSARSGPMCRRLAPPFGAFPAAVGKDQLPRLARTALAAFSPEVAASASEGMSSW